MQAMILAAGFGTRLLPHTEIKPKPLFPIFNIPLLQLTIARLKNYGFDHIIVNCHHLREQIAAAIADIDGVVLQEEEIILGTGGGLRKALSLCRDEPLLATNGDIYHCIDLTELYNIHKKAGHNVTMALHDCPRFNSVTTDGKIGVVGFDSPGKLGNLAFTGIHVVEPDSLKKIEEDGFSCIIDHYRNMIARGERIHFVRTDGSFWTDMGTEKDYLKLHEGIIKGDVPPWKELGRVEMSLHIHPEARIGRNFNCADWVCIGASDIDENVALSRCVVWDGVHLERGSVIQGKLISSSSAV